MKYKILKCFSSEECELIIKDFEKNKNNFKISKEHGVKRISSYEIDIKNLSEDISNLIYDRCEKNIRKLTGGKFGMIFGIKYSLDTKPGMSYHYDCNSYSCVIKLNDDYNGGGTIFPLSNKIINLESVGDGLLFKSDTIKSYHGANPITSGVRYVLSVRIEKKNMLNFLLKAFILSKIDFFIRKFYKNI